MQEININVTETGCQRSPLLIGYQGENEVTRVIVDYSAWTEEFGAGSLALEVMRSGDEIPYLAPLTIADGKAIWLVSNVDTGAEGVGAAGFVYAVGDQIKKSAVFRFFVGRDIGGDPGERPDPYEGVIAHIEKLVKEAEDNAAAAETAQTAAETAQTAAEAARDAAASLATDAAGSATTAAEQAQAAATARAAAETAQTAAEVARNAAASSATDAAGSATTATEQAQAAATARAAAESAQTAAETAVSDVDAAKTGAVQAVNTAKTDALTAIEQKSTTEQAAVEQKGEDALAALQEYADLPGKVDDLKSAINTKAPVIINTASGAIASFDDGADDMPVKKLVVSIEPVQAGTGDPSPENIRPITGWTGCNIVQSPTLNAQDGTIYPITFPDSAGTVYGGTLDVVSGVLTVDRAKLTFNGSENWGIAQGDVFYLDSALPSGYARNALGDWFCNKYAVVNGVLNTSEMHDSRPDDSITNQPGQPTSRRYDRILIKSSTYTTVEAFKASLAQQALEIVFSVPNPQSYPLTAQQITTLLGTNNIWADCGDVSVDYPADTKLYIDGKIAELQATVLENIGG